MRSEPWRRELRALLMASCLLGPLPLLAQVAPGAAPVRAAEGSSRIGKADLEQARRLLAEARNELEPRHWALLDGKLAEAERAWDRFARLTRDSGRTADVARGAEGLVQAGRLREGESVRALPRVGPLLVLLVLLWPGRTAGPEYDELPPWLAAQQELEAKLRDLSKASEQVRVEIEAARKRPGRDAPEPMSTRPPKEVSGPSSEPQAGGQGMPPGDEPPCEPRGSGGEGQFKQGRPGWIRCSYWCGDRYVTLRDVWGTSADDCEQAGVLKRASRGAARLRREESLRKLRGESH